MRCANSPIASMRESAGISHHQAAQAVRVANIPAEKFEAAIEQPKPATVAQLAEMGKQVRSVCSAWCPIWAPTIRSLDKESRCAVCPCSL
jgi:hypothetical protein